MWHNICWLTFRESILTQGYLLTVKKTDAPSGLSALNKEHLLHTSGTTSKPITIESDRGPKAIVRGVQTSPANCYMYSLTASIYRDILGDKRRYLEYIYGIY